MDPLQRLARLQALAAALAGAQQPKEVAAAALHHATPALGAEASAALLIGGELSEMLSRCAGAIVRRMDAALARIWTLDEPAQVLRLRATEGDDRELQGDEIIPVGMLAVGRVAQMRAP